MKILFVCAANTSRSPAAEFIYNQLIGGRNAESAGLQPNDEIDARMVLALRKKYGGGKSGEALERFLLGFKPRNVDYVDVKRFESVYAMDSAVQRYLAKKSVASELFPPNGVKDPAAIYPARSRDGDVFLDCLNEVEKGVKLIVF